MGGRAVADPDGIVISGCVLDGDGAPVPDALIETWQSAPRAFARCGTDDDGRWAVRVPMPDATDEQAPHLDVNVFARGLLHRVVTRIYLTDDSQDACWPRSPPSGGRP